ncbi:MAG: type II toxin-antitoxin system VapC family toxin [Myxococcota bacterium]
MTRCVLDASTAVEILLATDAGQQALDIISDDTACVPHLFDVEVLSVLRRLTYRSELDRVRATEAVEDLVTWPLMRFEHTHVLNEMWQLRDSASAYDSAYAALAIVLDLPLLTSDSPLTRAGVSGLRVLTVTA